MRRYAIWDKQSSVITPIGEVLSAAQWLERYPVARLASITVVCAAGEINGAFFGTLGQMVRMAEADGVDFSQCTTDDERLALYENWEKERSTPVPSDESTPEERIAAALELSNMLQMPIVNDDDPDLD